VAGPVVLVVTVAGYLVSAAGITTIRMDDPPVQRAPRTPFLRSAAEGLRFVTRQPVIRALFLCSMSINSASMFLNAVHVVYVVTDLQVAASTAALLGVFQALGALLGSLAAQPVVRRLGIGSTKITGSLLMVPAVAILPLASFGPGPAEVYVGVANLSWGFLLVVAGLAGSGITPRLTPAAMLGRVTASSRLFAMGIMPIASLAGGALASIFSTTVVLWLGAALAGLSALPILCSPLRHWHTFPNDR